MHLLTEVLFIFYVKRRLAKADDAVTYAAHRPLIGDDA